MDVEKKFQELWEQWSPVIQVSMDGICLIDHEAKIIRCNQVMMNILGIRKRELSHGVVFTRYFKLAAKDDICPIAEVICSGKAISLDEVPAEIDKKKLRVLLRGMPVFSYSLKGDLPIGALISLRDTTGEILVQAKYHKAIQLLEEKDRELLDIKRFLNK